jgi:hypothetical protein
MTRVSSRRGTRTGKKRALCGIAEAAAAESARFGVARDPRRQISRAHALVERFPDGRVRPISAREAHR